ncbi:hypothetical protein MNV49_000011 [Pseudohyphozyma bogoriensis]|nr:hypothetical protein MNV49_000011 [Pseudohyphozyma bogoriensis]
MGVINNEFVIHSLTHPVPPHARPRQLAISSAPLVLRSLPPSSYLAAVALESAHSSRRASIISSALETALQTPLDALPSPPEEKRRSVLPTLTSKSPKKSTANAAAAGPNPDGTFEPFHVLRAIEKKDIMTIMEIRNRQFELLVQSIGGSTPLVHAMRHGQSHREVAILLTGAISKQVNTLTDEDLHNLSPHLKSLLRAIRANLKLAISYGIASSQTDLLASYLQVIIMSEGDKLIAESAQKVALALRTGPQGRPVGAARELLEKWVSKELKEQEVAAVGEYLNNATGDLVLMGLWFVATDEIPGEAIPTYYFARDDRITAALKERIESSIEIMEKRSINGRQKVDLLRAALDEL